MPTHTPLRSVGEVEKGAKEETHGGGVKHLQDFPARSWGGEIENFKEGVNYSLYPTLNLRREN